MLYLNTGLLHACADLHSWRIIVTQEEHNEEHSNLVNGDNSDVLSHSIGQKATLSLVSNAELGLRVINFISRVSLLGIAEGSEGPQNEVDIEEMDKLDAVAGEDDLRDEDYSQ